MFEIDIDRSIFDEIKRKMLRAMLVFTLFILALIGITIAQKHEVCLFVENDKSLESSSTLLFHRCQNNIENSETGM